MLHALLLSLALSILAPTTVVAQRTPDCPSSVETCGKGYVWREAYGRDDHTCVLPSSRLQAFEDNAQAGRRRLNGSDKCKPGFVWREAEQEVGGHRHDHVCVTEATKMIVMEDNKKHKIRLNQECLGRGAGVLGPLLGAASGKGSRQPPFVRRDGRTRA